MNKIRAALLALMLANVGCASERLYVKVVDEEGRPVSNAAVNVDFTSSHVVLGKGTDHRYEAKTDTNGNAVVKFNCTTSDFGWRVEANGYYRSDVHMENFKGEDVIVPPGLVSVKLHEHEKQGEVKLYRKKNPQPMYAYTREKGVKSPVANGRYGFDLQLFDWLPPHGKGKVADFYYVRERPDETDTLRRVRDKGWKVGRAVYCNEHFFYATFHTHYTIQTGDMSVDELVGSLQDCFGEALKPPLKASLRKPKPNDLGSHYEGHHLNPQTQI